MKTRLFLVLVLVATCTLTLTQSVAASGTPQWVQVNSSGFGDPNMGLISSLESFKGRIFASASPDLLPTRPGVAQVWSMGPRGKWTPMMTDGFGNPNNFGINHLFTFRNRLYAATMNYTEGGEVWRSRDGRHWQQVASGGFGDPLMGEIFRFFEFKGQLYVGTVSYHPGDYGFDLWRSSTGDPGDWTRVVANAFGNPLGYVLAVEAQYDGYLYVGTCSAGTGAEIWRTTDGENWEQVPISFGEGIWSVDALAVYKGYLYAGTFETWPDVGITGDRLFRCQKCDGSDWEQVVFDGFGNPNTGYESALAVYRGQLYFVVGNPVEGLQVWRTKNGLDWEQVAWNGFDNPNNLNPYFSNSVAVLYGQLFIGTLNLVDGGQVWMLQDCRPGWSIGRCDQ
jgi:hypothetical protein